MAVVTTKSASVTNRDASPKVLNNSRGKGSDKKISSGIVTTVSGDDIASKYIFCSVPSNAIVHSVKVSCPDIGTTTIADFGIYQTTANGGAVVDADCFGSAVSLKDGALTKSEIVNEANVSGVGAVADMEKPLWQRLGLSADSQRDYDVVATLTAAADAAAAIFVEVEYSI